MREVTTQKKVTWHTFHCESKDEFKRKIVGIMDTFKCVNVNIKLGDDSLHCVECLFLNPSKQVFYCVVFSFKDNEAEFIRSTVCRLAEYSEREWGSWFNSVVDDCDILIDLDEEE